jgi:AcrR family transcriptional regulator
MADDKKGGSGDKPRCDDLAKMLANADPADRDKLLEQWHKRRKQAYNYEMAARLVEEAGELLRNLTDEERDKEDDFGRIVDYFRGYDPEPLLRQLISGPPLSREGQLCLAQALAEVATKDGGQSRRVLKDTSNRVGRPRKMIDSDIAIEIADQVREKQKTVPGNQRDLAIQEVAAERGVTARTIYKYLEHEDVFREMLEAEDD